MSASFIVQPPAGDGFKIVLTTAGTFEISGQVVSNEAGADVDHRFEGDTATSLVVIDGGLDAFQIGTTVAGAIADFRAASIVLNEGGADMDIRFEAVGQPSAMFIQGSDGFVGIGTAGPGAPLEVSRSGAGDNLWLGSSAISHGFTAVVPTGIFAQFYANNGLLLRGFADGDNTAFTFEGYIDSADPADTTPAIVMTGGKWNGATSTAPLEASETVWQLRNFITPAVTVLGSGNVGIGTGTPSETLQVVGNIDLTGVAAAQILSRTGSSPTYGPLVIRFANAPSANVEGIVFRTSTDGTHTTSTDRLTINDGAATANIAFQNSVVIIGGTSPQSGYELTVNNDIYAVGNVSALTITDRTDYPESLTQAYRAVKSLRGKAGKLDHDKLDPFVKARDGRNLSALVSAQAEVIKDLIARVDTLEAA
ncbi:hypothetical protein A2198_05590 [Candidatus Peribacteria bacterium RIFOXYA1_FULL_56_14]|nr:MAG: hypothetical protein A2198_05590 [Candidatus Peribacteria bacterium RIFOXYA1_FULL_56_14]